MVTGLLTVQMGRNVTPEVFQSFLYSFKKVVVDTSSKNFKKGLPPLKLHLPEHIAEDINRIDRLKLVHDRPLGHLNLTIKQSYRTTSLRNGTRTT